MHPNKWLLWTAGVLLIAATVAVTWLHAAPAPTVGALSANPAYIVIKTPTDVVFTISITDPTPLMGVNLLQVDSTGKTLSTVGAMHDDGLNGDVTAGDKVFSFRVSVNQPATGQVFYRGSAAFKGVLQRVVSGIARIAIWNSYVAPDSHISLDYPSGWNISSTTDSGQADTIYLTPLDKPAEPDAEFVADLVLRVYPNPRAESLSDFYNNAATAAELNYYLSSERFTTFTTSRGLAAAEFVDVAAMVPTTVISVNTLSSVVELHDVGQQHVTDGLLHSIANSIR